MNERFLQRKQRKAMSEKTNAQRSTVQRSQSTFDLLTQGACSRNNLVSNFVSQQRLEVVVPDTFLKAEFGGIEREKGRETQILKRQQHLKLLQSPFLSEDKI